MTLEMCSSSGNDLLNQVFLSEEHSHEESQKKRKLTNDSGYGDDIHERIESLHSNSTATDNQSFTRTSSLDSISENHTNSTEQAFHELKTQFETSLNCGNNSALSDNLDDNSASFDCVDSNEEQIVETSKTKEKRRRMTPVPGGVSVFKPSKNSPLVTPSEKKNHSGRTILFVEEEDTDDIEGYNLEDDFICPDLLSCTSKLNIKRNSWHGITEGEKFAKFNKNISLTKSKSLDRGTDYPRTRRKRLGNMNIPSISLEELTIDKRPGLTKQRSLNGDFTEPRCLFDGINILNKSPSRESDSHLPAWMQEAVEQDSDTTARQEEMHSCEEEMYSCEEENEDEVEKRSMEKLSTKLAIPEINWDKLNEEKNKTNKLLSEQRKALNKEKTKASSRRRRKLTPSESPSHASLEKLSSFKTKSEEWTLTEEAEEEEEENL